MPQNWTYAQHRVFKAKAAAFRFHRKTQTLHRKHNGRWTPYITLDQVAPLLRRTHNEAGHFNDQIVYQKLLYRVWWSCMLKDIYEYIQGCIRCALWSSATASQSQHMTPLNVLHPNKVLQIDLMVPYPPTPDGNTYALVIVDVVAFWID